MVQYRAIVRECKLGMRVPENPGNLPIFKPGFVCGEKPGFYGFNLTLNTAKNYEEIKVK